MKRRPMLAGKARLIAGAVMLAVAGGHLSAQTAAPQKAKAYMVADAHLDTQWNWDIQTTIKEYVWNTLNQNLFLLNQYPDYIFNFEGGVKYAWMKEYYPREYELMKAFVKAGRWHVSGASWDATDTLVPSIESFIRNIMLGQEFYRKELGVESTDIFLPDCFGFGWTLPTVAAHCGLIGFSSQKLDWRNNPFYGKSKHPFTVGLWKGVDGASVMLAHGYDYGRRWDNEDLSENKYLMELSRCTPLNTVYRYYGTGDVGGSPTIASVASVEKGIKGDGPLKIISATSDQLFKDYQPYDAHSELPVFDGELLMDVHGTGCYTSQAAMKLYNRQNELLGDAAERASVAAALLGTAEYPGKSLTESWQRFIFHQFHDDLTGTSIPRAYEFSWNDELLSLKQFSGILTHAVGSVAGKLDTRVKGIPVVLYNASGFKAADVVTMEVKAPRFPKGVAVYNEQGKQVASQLVSYTDGKVRLLVEATVPANGYAVYDVRLSGEGRKVSAVEATSIENSLYKLTLNENGDITSLLDKKNNKELVKAGKAIRLALFTENESFEWPAWEILKKTVDATPISITEDVKMTLCENGALRKTLCVEKRHGDSFFRQYIHLYEGILAHRIDFTNEVDWQSANALLKAEFPLNLNNEKATYDLGVGSVQRGNNSLTAYEVYAQYWADLTDANGSYGVSIMNDSKYGWDKPDNNTLRLTLLHTPKTKSNYAYQDRQDFGRHTFTYSLVGHTGALDVVRTRENAELLNQRIKAFAVGKHRGELGKSYSLAFSDNRNVLIKALKKAESSDEYVVRVYEAGGKQAQKASIVFADNLVAAVEADGTEKTIGKAAFSGNRLEVSVNPNGIKTYKVRFASNKKVQTVARPLPLAYDKKCFSWNEFKAAADFEAGYSYAAELIPTEMNVNGVPFKLETREELNGMACKGNVLKLPADCAYNRLYILAAAASDKDVKGIFRTGKSVQEIIVPSYTGFIGQWGHTGHTEGYLKDAEVAYVGTHRHSGEGDQPYEFTYMFKFAIDLPEKATEVVLPDNKDIVIFAATLTNVAAASVCPVSELFRTANKCNRYQTESSTERVNILKQDMVMGYSSYVNEKEKPAFMVDGDENTKWCAIAEMPHYVDFDLGSERSINGWKLLNAAGENHSYITSSCFLQGKTDKNSEWRTLDYVSGNGKNVLNRTLNKPESVRYLRLLVTQPMQSASGKDVRIYEMEVYAK
ncbi:glycoside hydrolase family 38 C-terminal domain-containing protein [Bacteroides muris (ex Afrizal et al. 2022)]|uniref:Alpha-mannosidase n=1 Tax=Bacteroides muris (ex Afrizal et al. 2022) TaxID=2516960 RepID=A0A4S2B6Z3_9BACE|nr:glycoside hydrolase family 38 C-terminal domain-containing protein [Bacteroides muris (ex Afrizal et al. 2022)]TGY09761.1 alpha-mannosidase [Bacteroides muris (ex Afrizal et al. 2022)]